MKPTKKQLKQIENLIEKWRGPLYLHEWFIGAEFPDEAPEGSVDREVLAEASVDPVYKNVTIKVHKAWFSRGKQTQEFAIVHELCHCHTQEVWDMLGAARNGVMVHDHSIRDAIEALTQRMAIIAANREWSRK